tara:strand:+ start:8595 stop:9590 length:996 start_codon:yes stop_codon:yes gene_type:complete
MKLLVCGGMGFIGSAFIRNHITKNPKDKIINLDNLTTGSNIKNLEGINKTNYDFIEENIDNTKIVDKIVSDIDVLVNFAAETHVDRSISNPKQFLETNILGTHSLLEATKKHDRLFVHISTDEIYGDAVNQNSFTEKSTLNPSNPYSASKAAAEHLINSFVRTYKTKSIITRCTNNFGPFQFPEKLIPKTIIRAEKNLKIPLYGDGNQIRSWIYVLDHVSAIESIIAKGDLGETYNITSWNEISNKTIVEKILDKMGKPNDLIEFVGDRPGHDKRYSIDSSKIQNQIGWKPEYDFDNALKQTVDWYLQNKEWWEPLADERMLHPQPWTLSW